MTFNIYNTLIIAGIIQGFIFAGIVIFSKKYHAKSTFFLISLILCYSISNFMYVLPDVGVVTLFEMYAYIFLPFASLIAPIIYFYVQSFLYPSNNFSIKEKSLIIPFLLFLSLVLLFRLRVLLGYDKIDPINTFYSYMTIYHDFFSVVYSLSLLIVILTQLHRFEKQNLLFDKNHIHGDIKWLKTTLYIIFLLTLLWGYLAIRNIFFTNGETVFYSLWISMTALIYWLGHIGIYNYGINVERKNIRDIIIKNPIVLKENHSKNEHIAKLENFLKKEKAYLNPKLTLGSVAEQLNISTGYLSRIIHMELDTSFTEYIHSLRIEEAKMYLLNPEFSDYTMTSIGLEAGFNSRSAFFEIFKKDTGKTPLNYKKRNISA